MKKPRKKLLGIDWNEAMIVQLLALKCSQTVERVANAGTTVACMMVTVIWEDSQSIYISADFVLIYSYVCNCCTRNRCTYTTVTKVTVFYIPKPSYTSFYTLPKYVSHNLCENCTEGLLFKKFKKKNWETVSPPLGYIEALQI